MYSNLEDREYGLDELAALPIVEKSLFKLSPAKYSDSSLITSAVQHTGGTSGNSLLLRRSPEERAFCADFFEEVLTQELREHSFGEANESSILCLSLYGHFHGEALKLPFPGRVFELNNYDTFWDIQTLLSNPKEIFDQRFEDIIISGFESQIRLLTLRLIEQGFDFSTSLCRGIFCTGDHVSRRLQRWYQTTWGAPLVSRYSLTEMVGGARPCEICGFYHFEPNAIGEIVDFESREPIDSGAGELLITCLYPFVQKQPLIRYSTGDAAYRGPTDCPKDEFSFEFAGRLSTCLIDTRASTERIFLSSARVYDVLDEYPEVARNTQFDDHPGVSDYEALGYLKFSIEDTSDDLIAKANIFVEMKYNPAFYPEHAAAFANKCASEIVSAHPELAGPIGGGKFQVSIVPRYGSHLTEKMIAQIE